MSAQRKAALTYAAMNMYVFPCKPGGKVPATRAGFHDATTDYDQIKAWWNHNPDYNIGVRPWPDCAVIDVDVSGDKTGDASLAALVEDLGPLPKTWVARTASGGRHIWLRIGDDLNSRGAHKSIAPFVDVKIGKTGYLVMPPSRTANGTYRWLDPERTGVPPGLPADAPEAWRERILKPLRREHVGPVRAPAASGENPVYVAAALAGELNELAGAVPGGRNGDGRNITLHKVACRLYGLSKGGHVDRNAAETEMRRISNELGLPDSEIDTVFRSAWNRTGPEHPPALSGVPPAHVLVEEAIQ